MIRMLSVLQVHLVRGALMSTIREILVAQAFEPHRYPHENLRATNAQNVLGDLTLIGGHSLVTENEWKEHVGRKMSKTKEKEIQRCIEEAKCYGWDMHVVGNYLSCTTLCNCCDQRFTTNLPIKFKKGKVWLKLPIYCPTCIAKHL